MTDSRDPARGYSRPTFPEPTGQGALTEHPVGGPVDDDLVDEFARAQAEEYGEPAYDAYDTGYDPAYGLADPEVDHEADSRRSRREGQRHAVQRRRRRLRVVLVLIVTLAVVAGAGYFAVGKLKPLLSISTGTDDFPGPGSGQVKVTVNDGDTASAIGTTLQTAGVVKSARAFAKVAAADPKGASIQPGSYTMLSQMTSAAALAILVDPANRTVPRVTIREGLWKSETFAALSKATGVPLADYTAAAKDTAALGLPAAAKGNLEGYLYPSTYEFPEGATAAEQLQTMVAMAVKELSTLGVTADTMEKIVITASIVQAEGRRAEDLPKIARVIDNRLAVPMRLQLDSTVSYGVQKRALTTSDAERAQDNGYNTYVRDGLPVGPISNPGEAALQAALSPAAGPWIYFVAVNPDTGETKFATTAAEHQANVQEFQQWCSQNPGKC